MKNMPIIMGNTEKGLKDYHRTHRKSSQEKGELLNGENSHSC